MTDEHGLNKSQTLSDGMNGPIAFA